MYCVLCAVYVFFLCGFEHRDCDTQILVFLLLLLLLALMLADDEFVVIFYFRRSFHSLLDVDVISHSVWVLTSNLFMMRTVICSFHCTAIVIYLAGEWSVFRNPYACLCVYVWRRIFFFFVRFLVCALRFVWCRVIILLFATARANWYDHFRYMTLCGAYANILQSI